MRTRNFLPGMLICNGLVLSATINIAYLITRQTALLFQYHSRFYNAARCGRQHHSLGRHSLDKNRLHENHGGSVDEYPRQ